MSHAHYYVKLEFRILELEWNLEIILFSPFVDEETDYMAAQGPQLVSGRCGMHVSNNCP